MMPPQPQYQQGGQVDKQQNPYRALERPSQQTNANWIYHNVPPPTQATPQMAGSYRPFTVIVQQHFIQERDKVNSDHRFSHDFEIPLPGETGQQQNAHSQQPLSMQTNTGQHYDQCFSQRSPRNHIRQQVLFPTAQTASVKPQDFYNHERNKYLAVMQASKKWIDLSKTPELVEKRAFMTLLSICLCKKALLLIEHMTTSILNKQDTHHLAGFADFCKSSLGDKFVQECMGYKSSTVKFHSYLEGKLNELRAHSLPLDESLTATILNAQHSEATFDHWTSKLLVSVLAWTNQRAENLKLELYRGILAAALLAHHALNLKTAFPLEKDGGFGWKDYGASVEAMETGTLQNFLAAYLGAPDELASAGGQLSRTTTAHYRNLV